MQEKSVYNNKNRAYRNKISLYTADQSLDESEKKISANHSKNKEQVINIIIEESDLLILLTNEIKKECIEEKARSILSRLRNELKAFIMLYPEFEHSLSPLQLKNTLSFTPLIHEMQKASQITNIGPFASVAGTVAEFLAKELSDYLKSLDLPSDIIVENGGDIYIISSIKRIVALLDKPEKDLHLGLEIEQTDGLSIAASSATIGHSKSFGKAELCVILSKNAALADSMATAICNAIKSPADFNYALELYKKHERHGLVGIFSSCNDNFLAYGDIVLTKLQPS